ncbi:MAG: DUF2628 domain-containing protein [Oscillospiraceae bacterium]|jgi:hypothetical protein|nr:DUF2628 domain-containing protein [Oscillospiraceae bacterium]
MIDYTGLSCPHCDEKFNKGDDIVVCPECGAPHHRACWFEEGQCSFKVLHDPEFEWKRPEEAAPPPVFVQGNPFAPAYPNSSEDTPGNAENQAAPPPPGGQFPPQNGQRPNGPFFFNISAPAAMGIKEDELIEGITVKELLKFLGASNVYYYLRAFYNMTKRGISISFNFMAFLFSGIWFFSKKMYFMGCVAAMIVVIPNTVASVITYFFVPANANESAVVLGLSSNIPLTYQSIIYLLGFVQIAAMILFGLFANKMYLNHCKKQINAAPPEEEDRKLWFMQKGSVNLPLAACLYICYTIFKLYLPTLLSAVF